MKKRIVLTVVALLFALAVAVPFHKVQAAPSDKACWGQASKVFAQTGVMGEHSSQQPTPRLGLANLARLLYEAGVLDDDSMQALGSFVASELGLSIDACMVE